MTAAAGESVPNSCRPLRTGTRRPL